MTEHPQGWERLDERQQADYLEKKRIVSSGNVGGRIKDDVEYYESIMRGLRLVKGPQPRQERKGTSTAASAIGEALAAAKEKIEPTERVAGSLFTKMPVDLLTDPNVSDAAKLLYAALACHAFSKTKCYPSVRRLAQIRRCSRRQVQRCLEELEQADWIKRVRTGRATEYHLNT